MKINHIYNEDCLDTMSRMNYNFIDLVITSPPYDALRTYNGIEWNESIWKAIIKELFRVTKIGGVVVWVVGDATIKGSETGTSFKQALWAMECGFNLHDTMIYAKNNYVPLTHNRYEQQFEFMFVFSKGKPNVFNPIMIPTKTVGTKRSRQKSNKEVGSSVRNRDEITETKQLKQKPNIWFENVSQTNYLHPAIFPEKLAEGHIISWSNEGDLIYDPFMGSGTVAKIAIENKRNWVGSEISNKYCEIIKERIVILQPNLL